MSVPNWIETRCDSCGLKDNLRYDELVEMVRKVGHLRRSKDPSPEMIFALLGEGHLPTRCTACNSATVRYLDPNREPDSNQPAVDFEGWPDEQVATRKCQSCGQIIDPDRLEVFPDTTKCVACQNQKDQQPADDYGFCSFCGGRLTVGQRGGSGLSGYQLRCTDCGRAER